MHARTHTHPHTPTSTPTHTHTHTQYTSGVVLVVSFFLIPVFFGSDFAQQFCGTQAGYYQKGQCSIDWSLYMGMVVSACSLYLPAIAVFALNIADGVKAPVCC